MFCPYLRGTGLDVQGGHAEYMLMYADATYLIPDKVSDEQAAPIFCAGYTVYSGLRWADPQPHERVAVLGIGGLGHLAVQYAKAGGFETIAISHSPDKDKLIRQLGADEIVRDGKSLAAVGGADIILSTSNSTKSMVDSMQGLLYLHSANRAKNAKLAKPKINNLRRLNTGRGIESHPHRLNFLISHRNIKNSPAGGQMAGKEGLRNLSKECLKPFCDIDSSALRIDEQADVDRKAADGLRRKVLPKILSRPDGDANSLCNFIIDLRADCNQRIAIACAIIHLHRVTRIEVGCVHVAPVIGSLAESTDRKVFSDASNPVLDAKSQCAIAEICFDPVARGVASYTRCPSESVETQSPQIPLQENSWTESGTISSGQHASFDGRRFRLNRVHGEIIHARSCQDCGKS
jgi:hypothetical protein